MGIKEFDVQSVCLYKRYLMGNTIKWRVEKMCAEKRRTEKRRAEKMR